MSRLPPRQPRRLLVAFYAFTLMVFTNMMLVDTIFGRYLYDGEMVPSQNITSYKGGDAIPTEQRDDENITREEVVRVMKKMHDGNLINKNYFVFLLQNAKIMLQTLETVYDIPVEKSSGKKVTIIGDTHGQYNTLLHIFQVNGWPSPKHIYILNGDYTDKGDQSIENLTALIMFKLHCPKCIHFTRGNHETESFLKIKVRTQLINQYDEEVYDLFMEVIHEIPLAVILANKMLILHGGVHSGKVTIDEMKGIKRGMEPITGSLLDEFLWCDPMDKNGIDNDPQRGCLFGPDVSRSFLERNNLDLIIRGHENVKDGNKIQHNGKVITIWSSPNKPGRRGSYLNVDDSLKWTVEQFDAFPKISEIEDWIVL